MPDIVNPNEYLSVINKDGIFKINATYFGKTFVNAKYVGIMVLRVRKQVFNEIEINIITKELQELKELKNLVMALVKSKKRFIKLSERRSGMSHQDNTPKAIENAECNLNWHAMEYDKLFRDVHAVAVDCGIASPKDDYNKIEYNPSAWHKYSYHPRIPNCRR